MPAREFLIILPIDDAPIGEAYSSAILHCTLVRWFRISENETTVADIIARVIRRDEPLRLLSVALERFGPKHDTPAHVLERDPRLLDLHTRLVSKLSEFGAQHRSPQYILEHFRPHVTKHEGRSFPIGSSLLVSNICLVRKTHTSDGYEKKEIVASLRL